MPGKGALADPFLQPFFEAQHSPCPLSLFLPSLPTSVPIWTLACHTLPVKARGKFAESVLSFYKGPRNQTQVTRLLNKHVYC